MYRPGRIVDPHIHLWDLAKRWYPILEGGADGAHDNEAHPVGDFSALIGHDFLPADYRSVSTNWPVDKVVHITAAQTPSSWVAETEWLQSLYETTGRPHGIIGWIDLDQEPAALADEITKQRAFPNFRGFRHLDLPDLASPRTVEFFTQMGAAGLIYDLVAHHDRLADAARLIAAFPKVPFVLEHTGWPLSTDPAAFDAWRDGMGQIAAQANAFCKISGLGMAMNQWSVEDLEPWVKGAIDIFGADRCMIASNFPIDRLYSSFDALYDAFVAIIQVRGEVDMDKLFFTNAERIYGL